jgi:precorrin-6Y C5,15-methyltransferase (decarboxylating)
LEACWDTLSQSGRLVSNSVTLEAQQAVMDFRALHGGDITRIDVSRAGPVGELNALRPFRGVLQLAAVKS